MKIINTIKINFYSFLWKLTKSKYFELKFINAVIKDVRDKNKIRNMVKKELSNLSKIMDVSKAMQDFDELSDLEFKKLFREISNKILYQKTGGKIR